MTGTRQQGTQFIPQPTLYNNVLCGKHFLDMRMESGTLYSLEKLHLRKKKTQNITESLNNFLKKRCKQVNINTVNPSFQQR